MYTLLGFPGGSEVKASACSAGDPGLIPGLGRSPGEGNGNPLQYSCLENPTDGGAWQVAVHGVAKSRTRLSDFTSLHFLAQQEVPRSSCTFPDPALKSTISPKGPGSSWWGIAFRRQDFGITVCSLLLGNQCFEALGNRPKLYILFILPYIMLQCYITLHIAFTHV